MSYFEEAVNEVLKTEGGFVNHPADKGGATNLGITQSTLEWYRGTKVTVDAVKNLKIEEVKNIYKKLYWDKMKLDLCEKHYIAMIAFDQAVNRGVMNSAMMVQDAVGVSADGLVGKITMAAINASDERTVVIKMIKSSQLAYARIVKNNPSQAVFIEGWIARTHRFFSFI